MTAPRFPGLTPYHSRGGVDLYHGDCLELLPRMGREWAHLLLTDPPYGVSYRSKFAIVRENHRPIAGDESTDVALAGLAAAYVCLIQMRHVYAFGGPHLLDHPWLSKPGELVWDKVGMSAGDLNSAWGKSHELIGSATCTKTPKRNERQGVPPRLRRGTVLRFNRPHGAQCDDHPTIKPVPLLRELIESSSRMGEVVLDPFCGSGTTLAACVLERRLGVGIELDEVYCERAARRLDALFERGGLFGPEDRA